MNLDKLGYYLVNAGTFRIKLNKDQTNMYAVKLNEDDNTWEYAPGAVNNLRLETKMTLEQAKHYGQRTGRCMVCQRTLTKKESIDQGIGPICISKF